MKKTRLVHLILIFMSSAAIAQCQNLVPNPSFEQYKKLNCEWLRLLYPFQNSQLAFDSLLYDWVTPDYRAGVDLFSTLVNPDCYKTSSICNTSLYCTTNPLSIGAYPKDGNNMCLLSLLGFYQSKNNSNTRGYLQTPLVSQLAPNTSYVAGCYTMLPTIYYGDFACNNLGMLFTAEALNSTSSGSDLLRYTPQVNQAGINKDHGVWKKVFGCFTSTGNEQFLTIGNFYDDNHTKAELIVPQYDPGSDFASYVIDSVFTEEVKNPFIPNVITPNGDGLNDKFVIEKIHYGWWSLEVVNRWGKQVYQSSDYRNTWTGDNLSVGVYYYELQHRCPGISYKGSITILR